MHAVLLAAGMGRRLHEITGGGPKCLLPFGDASLLERHLRLLAGAGIRRLTVVVGFEAMQIEQALGALVPAVAPALALDTAHNPAFRQGSAQSVLAARRVLESGEDVLLMDADVLYDHRLLDALLTAQGPNALGMDRGVGADDAEAVKVGLEDGRIVAFDKTLPDGLVYDVLGESVGFFRLSPAGGAALAAECERVGAADEDASYEAALQRVMRAGHIVFEAVDVTGLPWIEIDYPADAARAADEIVPQLQTIQG
ncbi:phosphocholine cytidylyltransferase family protein [Salinisphaera sp.]|uniref:phosphocholine cytidylyltransferase family protein n=1 Tax=Salinisphaera sp. TaxID=1914330 RepID=UPI002D779BD6|nr:phosphocholine cytidylyltransferase family protein [Salinisphaera sp.]HET7312970.1 phosphocholine cytidylyltransferase family protein [Salinisphaera sp.]